jgi:glycosyltransferase involved in cell wall biosynthesis
MDGSQRSAPHPDAVGPRKILVVHNVYQQRGGEEAVVAAESRLLQTKGHTVIHYERHNDELRDAGALGRISAAANVVWSSQSYHELADLIAREQPDVAHFHNTFPLISPSAYYACARAGLPTVQTLHNYRLLCPGAKLLRDGRICESCVGRDVAWPAVLHGCYRGSRAGTAAAATMLAVHRALGSWKNKVDVYVALTQFARAKFIEGGLPAERIVVKPNFVDEEIAPARARSGQYALFVGRLSEEKGPELLLSAWRGMREKIPLRIAGDGPLVGKLSRGISDASLAHVELVGHCTPARVRELMQGARFLVLPSVWYEGFPITIVEAYARGLPVVASRLGSVAEVVQPGVTGLHFDPGDAVDLAAKVEWVWQHPEELARMSLAARTEYELRYQPSSNYETLMGIYEAAAMRRSRQAHPDRGVATIQV